MKKLLLTLIICLSALLTFADTVLIEGFEYGNQDLAVPVGWTSEDQSWLSGKFDKDHNRAPHDGNWYAFTNADESWMFMELFMSNQLQYRYYCWAVSDGSYLLEFWGGTEANPESMQQLLLSATVNSGNYEQFSGFVETISQNYPYLGIHAVAAEGAYHLTIDDVIVNYVDKYDMEVDPYEFDTVMVPGASLTYHYELQDLGYEPLDVTMHGYSDFFKDVHFTHDGIDGASFHIEPNQTISCTCTATLNPDIATGTLCWLDILFTVSCDCITRMTTLWATAVSPADIQEQQINIHITPNPADVLINVSAQGLKTVSVTDLSGRTFLSTTADGETVQLQLDGLRPGVYLIQVNTTSGNTTQKILKQ